MAWEIAAPFGHGLLTRMGAAASGLAVRRLAVRRVAWADRVLRKPLPPPAPTPLTLAVAPVLPVDGALPRLDSTEAGLTSDGTDARRARFGPNVLTSQRVMALGVPTRQLRNLAPWPYTDAMDGQRSTRARRFSPLIPPFRTAGQPGLGSLAHRSRDPIALASLVAGVVGLAWFRTMAFAIQSLRFGSAFMYIQLFWPLLSLAAIALGVVAHRRIRFSGKSGRQMASSAIVLGVVALVFSLWVLSGLIFQISLYLLFR